MKNNKKLTMENITVEEWNALDFDGMMAVLNTSPDWKLCQKWMRWFGRELHRRKELAKIYPDYPKEFNEELARALFFEAYPYVSENMRKINKARLALQEKKHRGVTIWTKWGKCEVCGYEGVLKEIGLNWTCDNPACGKEMRDWYKNTLDKS